MTIKHTMLSLKTEADLLNEIPILLKEARVALGWRQADLAQRSGVHINTLSRFERTGAISLSALARLIVTLGLADRLLEALRIRPQAGPANLEAFVARPKVRQRVRPRKV